MEKYRAIYVMKNGNEYMLWEVYDNADDAITAACDKVEWKKRVRVETHKHPKRIVFINVNEISEIVIEC